MLHEEEHRVLWKSLKATGFNLIEGPEKVILSNLYLH